jgi:hypothetical protein
MGGLDRRDDSVVEHAELVVRMDDLGVLDAVTMGSPRGLCEDGVVNGSNGVDCSAVCAVANAMNMDLPTGFMPLNAQLVL